MTALKCLLLLVALLANEGVLAQFNRFSPQGNIGQPTDHCPALFALETACSCFSAGDGAVIECDGPQGPLVVEKMKTQTSNVMISKLVMKNAKIIKIGPHAFRNLNIKHLDMSGNKMTAIHHDAFRGLENTMVSLSLEDNRLTEVPTDSLRDMNSLKSINLKCNEIGSVFNTLFMNTSSLTEVNLACNKICQLSANAFLNVRDTLMTVILDNNCLQGIAVDTFRGYPSLMAIHMKYNSVQDLANIELMDLPNLIMLRLTGNNMTVVSKFAFKNVPNVRYIYMEKNSIRTILPAVWLVHPNIEILDLSFNDISEVPSNAFRGLEHLMQLNLEGNHIKDIAPYAFQNTPLLLLLLGQNCLTSVNAQMFMGVPYLRQLSLTHNNIELVQPLSFNHLTNMHMLDISHNRIQLIQPGALTASSHVTVLLQENPLVCTQDGYHIVQGGRPIHLINEKNVICEEDYENLPSPMCPTRMEIPPPPPCCAKTPITTTTTTTTTAAPTTTRRAFVTNGRVTSVPRLTSRARSSATIPPRTNLSVETPVGHRRPADLSRFWRLTRTPTSAVTAVVQQPTRPPSVVNRQPVQKTSVMGTNIFRNDISQQPRQVQRFGTTISPRPTARQPVRNPSVGTVPSAVAQGPIDQVAASTPEFMPGTGLQFGSETVGDLPPWVPAPSNDGFIDFQHDVPSQSVPVLRFL